MYEDEGAFGLESVKDGEGNVIKEAPLPVWGEFPATGARCRDSGSQQEADLKIKLASIERSKHRRVVALNFTIKPQLIPKGATRSK